MLAHPGQRGTFAMKLFCSIVLALFVASLHAQVSLIPQPAEYAQQEGVFLLQDGASIWIPPARPDWKLAAEAFAETAARSGGIRLRIRENTDGVEAAHGDPFLTQAPDLPPEAYRLNVAPNKVTVEAGSASGAFYALQTLGQLLPPAFFQKTSVRGARWAAPACRVADAPRFSWRGMHLDVGRHFVPLPFIKRYLDLMALHKFNTFHWHLTEDQGWRIEIKAFPRLQEVAACRAETLIGHYNDQPRRFDGKPYCAYYSQDEIRQIVAYARSRFIEIVPEIEMPGHSLAALAAYPELGCTGGPYAPATLWGVFDDVYCAGEERVFDFLEKVLDEVCALFPGPYIHIGGDECPKTRWKNCPKCQARMRAEGLANEEELQSYFIRRIEKILTARGKRLIGWDEILGGGLAPSASVMSWRGTEGGIAAARAGHNAVMCPGSHCYFDHYQGDPESAPLAIGGFTPLRKVYDYEPVPAELTPQEAAHILGAQGNVWTEYMPTFDRVTYMAYPRACALAEALWSPRDKRDWDRFAAVLRVHLARLDALRVAYSHSAFEPQVRFREGVLHIHTDMPDVEIRYTLDGADPDARSPRYLAPVPLAHSARVKAASFAPQGPVGAIRSASFDRHRATGMPYTLAHPPVRYTGQEAYALTNGVKGSRKSWENWVGWNGEDMEATLDLGQSESLTRVSVSFLDAKGSWIYPPERVSLSLSDDGGQYRPARSQILESGAAEGAEIRSITFDLTGEKARFLKVTARNYGPIPDGAQGAGHKAWLFADEIVVE